MPVGAEASVCRDSDCMLVEVGRESGGMCTIRRAREAAADDMDPGDTDASGGLPMGEVTGDSSQSSHTVVGDCARLLKSLRLWWIVGPKNERRRESGF